MQRRREFLRVVSAAAALQVARSFVAVAAGQPSAEKNYAPGVTDTQIKIGQTMPYSGANSVFGTVGRAEAAYFRMVNDREASTNEKSN